MDDSSTGYQGNMCCDIRYALRTRNLRIEWPFNNKFATSSNGEQLFRDLWKENVGKVAQIDESKLNELKKLLGIFLFRHRKFNYQRVLEKILSPHKFSTNQFGVNKSPNEVLVFDVLLYVEFQENEYRFYSKLEPLKKKIIDEFLYRVVDNVIPAELFGSKKMKIVFIKKIKEILCLGANQVYKLGLFLESVKPKEIPFLQSIKGNYNKTHILAKVYIWVFKVYILAVLKTMFYITDEVSSSGLQFYMKKTWQKLKDHSLNNIKKDVVKDIFLPLTKTAPLLKFLPKKNGIRPVCVRRKTCYSRSAVEAESLKTSVLLKFLKCIINVQKCILKVKNASHFNEMWKTIHRKWMVKKPEMYFVRVDFYDAYGSVNHEKLKHILDELCENRYKDIAELYFSTGQENHHAAVQRLKLLLFQSIEKYRFKDNKFVYELRKGIPQGGRLSASLCDLYFNHIDTTYLSHFVESFEINSKEEYGFLIRNCDDYLYLSSNCHNAAAFLEIMRKGFSEYELYINIRKIHTNVGEKEAGLSSTVDFGRYRLDVRDLQIRAHYSYYQHCDIFHTFKFRNVSNPGQMLRKRILSSSVLKLQAVFLNPNFKRETRIQNIALACNLIATRFVVFVNRMFTHYNHIFVIKTVMKCCHHVCKVVRKSSKKWPSDAFLHWMVLRSFHLRLQEFGGYLHLRLKKPIDRRENKISLEIARDKSYETFVKIANETLWNGISNDT